MCWRAMGFHHKFISISIFMFMFMCIIACSLHANTNEYDIFSPFFSPWISFISWFCMWLPMKAFNCLSFLLVTDHKNVTHTHKIVKFVSRQKHWTGGGNNTNWSCWASYPNYLVYIYSLNILMRRSSVSVSLFSIMGNCKYFTDDTI